MSATTRMPEILDHGQTQHDRNSPQFPQLERRDRLVGRHKPAKAFRIHAAVAVGNGLKSDVVDPWPTGRRPASVQAREFAAVALGQEPASHADLLFDEIEIVEQPFPGRRNAPSPRYRIGEQRGSLEKRPFVVVQPRQQAVGQHPPMSEEVGIGEHLAVQGHLLGAEQFGAQRRLRDDGLPRPPRTQPAEQAGPEHPISHRRGSHWRRTGKDERNGRHSGNGWVQTAMERLPHSRHATADDGPEPLLPARRSADSTFPADPRPAGNMPLAKSSIAA